VSEVFDHVRTVRTYARYFDHDADVLRDVLVQTERSLAREVSADVSDQIDREGSRLVRDSAGQARVVLHPRLVVALRRLAEQGIFGIFASTAYGGQELPAAIYFLAVSQIAQADAALALTFLVQGNGIYVIERFGSEEQRSRYLPGLIAGESLVTIAYTEADAGSDAGAIRLRADRDGDVFALHGMKTFVTHGGDANLLITSARTGPQGDGIRGVSTFLVERVGCAVELLSLEDKVALAGSPTATLAYDGVRVSPNEILGEVNKGGEVIFAGVGMTRVSIAAQALGIAKRAFALAAGFARERQQGGCTIIDHDAIRFRLLQMGLAISAMENLICATAQLEAKGEWHVREMSITKTYCAEAAQQVTQRAIGVLGGYGVLRGYEVERCRREVLALPLYGGTTEVQWMIISREIFAVVDGVAKMDYRQRDREQRAALLRRAEKSDQEAIARYAAVEDRFWRDVHDIKDGSAREASVRPVAEMAIALAVCFILLWQGSDPAADEFEQHLVPLGMDQLERAAQKMMQDMSHASARWSAQVALRRLLD
jgi:alkylation response protein AidB-like acyl-CoA dehydrogenase